MRNVVFSTSGNVVTCHWASLKPGAVDRLVFLAQNLHTLNTDDGVLVQE